MRRLQREIIRQYEADFGKHASGIELARLSMVWNSIPIYPFLFDYYLNFLTVSYKRFFIEWLNESFTFDTKSIHSRTSYGTTVFSNGDCRSIILMEDRLLEQIENKIGASDEESCAEIEQILVFKESRIEIRMRD